MTRAVLVLVFAGGCFESHPSNMQELANEACYTCHTPDYNGTTAPVHRDNADVFSTACVNCHRTTSWKPALEGLHDVTFIIDSGIHANIKCLACHDLDSGLPSKAGANTNCIQCHPQTQALDDSHIGATQDVTNIPYQYQSSKPSFCVDCHPTGRAPHHPDDLFPRTNHHAVACNTCHIKPDGPDTKGMNTTCVDGACHHTLSWSDGRHNGDVGSYPGIRGDGSNKHFCLDSRCHPDGLTHDNVQ